MATLYVENVPEELYKALRDRAKQQRKSIAAEVISLLEENVPTASELKRRQKFIRGLEAFQSAPSPGKGPFPSTEEMLREDRER